MKNIKREESEYEKYLLKMQKDFEAICNNCGLCCGANDGDPCINLKYDKIKEKYSCSVYNKRLGKQKTVSGKDFICVNILENMRERALHPNCAYNRISY